MNNDSVPHAAYPIERRFDERFRCRFKPPPGSGNCPNACSGLASHSSSTISHEAWPTEREGFEPSVLAHTRFQVGRIRPLCHLSRLWHPQVHSCYITHPVEGAVELVNANPGGRVT